MLAKKENNFYLFVKLALFFIPYLVATFLLYFRIIPYSNRIETFIIFSVLIFIYAKFKKYSFDEMGFGKKYIKESLFINGIFVIFIILTLLIKGNGIIKSEATFHQYFLIYYIFVSSILQEFLYRSVIYVEFKRKKISDLAYVVVSSLNYSIMHIFYYDYKTLLYTLAGGIIWGYIYSKYPNIWGVSFSHAFIGSLFLISGLV